MKVPSNYLTPASTSEGGFYLLFIIYVVSDPELRLIQNRTSDPELIISRKSRINFTTLRINSPTFDNF